MKISRHLCNDVYMTTINASNFYCYICSIYTKCIRTITCHTHYHSYHSVTTLYIFACKYSIKKVRGWDKTISASKTERVNSRFGNLLRFPLQSISATSVQEILEQCLLYAESIKPPQASPSGVLIRLFPLAGFFVYFLR